MVPGIISHLEALQEYPEYVRFMRALAANARVIAFDKRGNGLSDRMSGAPTLDERANDIDAVLDAAKVDRATLIGISEGGPISAVFAARRPDKVAKLVLCGSFAIGRLVSGSVTVDELKQMSAQLIANWGKVGGTHVLSAYGPGPEDPEGQVAFTRFQRLSTTPAGIADLVNLSAKIDIRGVLPSVQQPALVLRREQEPIPQTSTKMLADLIPNAIYRELPGDEHLPFRGNVDTYIDAILEFLMDRETVTHPPIAGHRVLASVLFTDLVGSTEKQVAIGDEAFRNLMNRHDDLSTRLIRRHNGRFVHSTGDGLLATFDAPTNAIACAVAIRDELFAMDLEVRAGVHTGEVELRGDDISGISVNIAARIADRAGTNEILTSDLTRQLMIGSNTTFEDRGKFDLKGVPGSWPLFAASLR